VASRAERSSADRRLLLAWLVAIFALSAVRDPRWLAGAGVLAALLFRRGLLAALRRTFRSVVPVTAGLSVLSLGWVRLVSGAWRPVEPFLALALRSAVIGLLTFAVLARVALLPALAPFPLLTRLLVVTLAQVHALRLLSTESMEGLRSRLPRRPGPIDLLRGAGGITAMLFTLATRNARDISDAMRSRGF
jgi:cobalt/nickel transport system permease protein